jgi:hypothetical protein
MSTKVDREVDRIVEREKPGYSRVAPSRRMHVRHSAADAGTPDLAALQATADALRLWDIRPGDGRRRAPAAPDKPPIRSSPQRPARRDPRGQAPATHHIVRVEHARAHEADPLHARLVVVSRSQNRIIGEQG